MKIEKFEEFDQKNQDMAKYLICCLEMLGFKAAIVPIKHLPELEESIMKLYRQNLFLDDFYQEWLASFTFHPPCELKDAKSLIVVAIPQPIIQVVFTLEKETIPLIIPPAYSHSPEEIINNCLFDILEPKGFRAVKANLPLKTLAVRSGLAMYGRNNITYVEGIGSFYRLAAFYTNIPTQEDTWTEPRMMPSCQRCMECQSICPTGAISPERFLLLAEYCVTYHTERKHDFPAWFDPSLCNCLVGCLRCQSACPMNKKVANWIEKRKVFSREETSVLLDKDTSKILPAELEEKLEQLGLIEYREILHRNLGILIEKKRKYHANLKAEYFMRIPL